MTSERSRGSRRDEDPCQSACRRRRRGRRLDRLSPGAGRLARRGAAGARRADLGLDLACGGALAAVQHGLCHQPHPRLLREVLQDAGGGDRAERGLFRGRQPAHGADARADGRIPALRLDRRDRGHPVRMADPGRDQGALAAGAHRGSGGRAVSPDRWLHQPRRRDHGDGQGRAAARRGDRPQAPGRRLRVDRVGVDRARRR